MMSGAEIRRIQREAAARAARQNLQPFVVWPEDVEHFQAHPEGFPFPFIGDYVPKGWRKVKDHFVDSSGFGMEGEPALTARQFAQLLQPGRGYAITEAGQFQVYVGEFERIAEAAA